MDKSLKERLKGIVEDIVEEFHELIESSREAFLTGNFADYDFHRWQLERHLYHQCLTR